ncbi:MAG TPA: 4-oxalocrotonate tautomerase [Ruminococcaceae bacterium]|nr:4-oxalocrotonate tautomerase [Oscillospiraceae bacterium]
MPYIEIKAYPKDEEIKKRVADRINRVFLEEWGCPQEAISLSIEEIEPQDWNDKVVKPEIEPNRDKMLILDGKKLYK